MKRLLFLLSTLLPCACRQAPGPRAAVRAAFVLHSGPVADPWSEQYDISATGVQFRRFLKQRGKMEHVVDGLVRQVQAFELRGLAL